MMDLVIIVSLALTVPFIGYCIEIVLNWHDEAMKAASIEKRERHHNLALGIYSGFTANALDNLYWFIAWMTFLFDKEYGMVLVAWGSLANIFFRQMGGLYAADLHLEAARYIGGRKTYRWTYFVLGFGLFLTLLAVAPHQV